MDNLTHSLVGWAIGQAGLKRRSRKGLAALVLGANMPDLDVFFGWAPWAPLAMHRGFTHGLVGGVLLMPPMLAGLLWLLDRWQLRRGARFASGLEMHFGWLVALSYIGAITHPLLDWQNSYAVQMFSPASNAWFHNDSLFIIDVWIWSGLAFAIWLSRRRERRGAAHWGRPAAAAVVALVCYIGFNSAITARAKAAVRSAPYGAPERIFATPPPVLFWRRDLTWRSQGVIRWGQFDPLAGGGLRSVSEPVADNMADPRVRRAIAMDAGLRDFLAWSTMPMASVEQSRCTAAIRFGDARFADRRTASQFTRMVAVPTGGTGCPPPASE
ncbi:metal-dependent hydrolase [Altererythrobacter sp. B11]|uniref:metal-dependent hydrolase n=1 Tax=Altererythrobacter sp. B11 TaxID=2060312 RepID=UPI000DC73EC1|nr:metal-dependent hydrolase [Altererythrobacter sp. B11]BBC72626.1 metal-dependent hydrolase [Altererythrobacter sp. B11]